MDNVSGDSKDETEFAKQAPKVTSKEAENTAEILRISRKNVQ